MNEWSTFARARPESTVESWARIELHRLPAEVPFLHPTDSGYSHQRDRFLVMRPGILADSCRMDEEYMNVVTGPRAASAPGPSEITLSPSCVLEVGRIPGSEFSQQSKTFPGP
jgi:hypothetical protein